MKIRTDRIGVVSIGKTPEIAAKTVAAHISGYLDLSATVLPALKTVTDGFNKNRLQYDVGKILQFLESRDFKGVDKILGITAVDLYAPIFAYVFGEARQSGKAAVISMFRLKQDFKEKKELTSLVLERTAKVALHELGHLFNLIHCADEKCLMHFSGQLEDLDSSNLYYCRYCSKYIKDASARF